MEGGLLRLLMWRTSALARRIWILAAVYSSSALPFADVLSRLFFIS
jgi:hypothetical protein